MNAISLPIYFTYLCKKELYLDKEIDYKDKGINMVLRIKSQAIDTFFSSFAIYSLSNHIQVKVFIWVIQSADE